MPEAEHDDLVRLDGEPERKTPNGSHDEFAQASQPGRRTFLESMGFLTAAVLAGCSRAPVERAIPFLNQPEEVVPGKATYYASTCAACPASCGLLVKTRDGRPIKIEPNAESPWGGSCAAGQASVLSLYDEARQKHALWLGERCSWPQVDRRVMSRLEALRRNGGRLVLLSGPIPGPSTRHLISSFLNRFPDARHVIHEAVSTAALRQANRLSFGIEGLPEYRLQRARLVVGLEADFLGTWISPPQFIRQYSSRRKPELGRHRLKHVQIEAGLSLTGSNADLRIPARPSQHSLIAAHLLREVMAAAGRPKDSEFPDLPTSGIDLARVRETARQLWEHRGQSLLISGINQVEIQLTVNAVNNFLGNVGSTVDPGGSWAWPRSDDSEVRRLIQEMSQGKIHGLILYGVNPAYDLPRPEPFLRGLEKVALSISFAGRLDETSSLVQAVCPDHHFLESWQDAQPRSTFYSLGQPAIRPLGETRSAQESLLKWMGQESDHYSYLRDFWEREVFPLQTRHARFEDFWNHTLHDGFLDVASDLAGNSAEATPDPGENWRKAVRTIAEEAAAGAREDRQERFEVSLYQTAGVGDGRHADNPWLQEMPDPVSKITWDNYACVSPHDASRLGLRQGDIVVLKSGETKLEVPICVQPGQARSTLSLALGYGRSRCGKAGLDVGTNAYPMVDWSKDLKHYACNGVLLTKTGRRIALAAAQEHDSMEERPIVRQVSSAEESAEPEGAHLHADSLPSLWPEHPAGRYDWGMSIDLNACVGCSACVIACQAENNVPVVGRGEVERHRDMHWIRIDRYYEGPPQNPGVAFQPMMCQHCANAPCETVCPVLATTRSSDGLNQQIYNRCIGTRYCSNNCPYKVRRFNWFEYARNERFDYHMNSDLGSMVLNPDVVVRTRGVMEKCSMCVQRIQEGKLRAMEEKRPVADGDVLTACQQTCPAEAIVFGDMLDPRSRVSRLMGQSRSYHVLAELGTKPNVSYLAKVRNGSKNA